MTRIIITGAKRAHGPGAHRQRGQKPGFGGHSKDRSRDDLPAAIEKTDVVIDFSFHTATVPAAELCVRHKKALVIGTTGHLPAEQAAIRKLQTMIPIVWASNYSTGVNALFWLARKAAEILGPGFDPEIVEMHHHLKKDARADRCDAG